MEPHPSAVGKSAVTVDPGTRTGRRWTVTRADPEIYEIHTRSDSHYVEFRLVLLYDSQSGVGEFAVDDGRTFAVTALTSGRARAYDQQDWTEAASPLVRSPERDPTGSGSPFGC